MNARAATAPRRAEAAPAWSEVGAELDREVQRLPAAHRDAFVLCALAGAGRAEAARQLGVQERTLGARLARARAGLEEALARRGIRLDAVLAALDLTGRTRPRLPGGLAAATARVAAREIGTPPDDGRRATREARQTR